MNERLNFFGEFEDRKLENEFSNQEMKKTMGYVKPAVLLLGILNTLFIIPDYFFIKAPDRFWIVLVCRLVFILLVAVLYVRIGMMRQYQRLAVIISVFEILAVINFFLVMLQYKNPDFLIQSYGIMIITLAIYMVPNRWLYMTVVSSASLAAFAVMSLIFIKDLKPNHFSAAIVYNLIVAVMASIMSQRSQRHKRIRFISDKELVRLSTTDPLTGIYNRAKFDSELKKYEAYRNRYGVPLSLIIFDFDDFKEINDTYGHLIGDRVIIDAVSIIKSRIRGTDVFARWGGEEFTILLPYAKLDAAVDLACRLRAEIEKYSFEGIGHVTCSFGVAELKDGEQVGAFLDRADKLLYRAKDEGKNRVKY